MSDQCKINISKNEYWVEITNDQRLTFDEIEGFNKENTKLDFFQVRYGYMYLKSLLKNDPSKGISVSQINIEKLNSKICEGAALDATVRRAFESAISTNPQSVTKGGDFEHDDVIYTVREQLVDSLNLDIKTAPPADYEAVLKKYIQREKFIEELWMYEITKDDFQMLMLAPSDEILMDSLLSKLVSEADKTKVRKAYEASRKVTDEDLINFKESGEAKQEELNRFYIDKTILTKDQVIDTLFDILKMQVKDRLKPEEEAIYKGALANYVDQRIYESDFSFTIGEVFDEGYSWLLDFKEEVDIPAKSESNGSVQFETIRLSAQGAFASTCGVYAMLSLFESMGQLEKFKSTYNVTTFADLDRKTFELMRPYPMPTNPYAKHSFRGQGISVTALPLLAETIATKLEIDSRYSFEQQEMPGQITAEFFEAHRYGFLANIHTSVGPHAVHVIGYNSKTEKVSYYDPIGKDGSNNIVEISLADFNSRHMKTDVFNYVTIARDAV